MTDPSDLGSTLWSLSVTEVKEDNTVAAHPITIAAHPITIAAHPITIAAQTYITWICLNLLHEGIIWANSPGSVQTAATIVLLLGFLCFWVFWKVENMPVILKKKSCKKNQTRKSYSQLENNPWIFWLKIEQNPPNLQNTTNSATKNPKNSFLKCCIKWAAGCQDSTENV